MSHIDSVSMWGDILQMAALELIRKVIIGLLAKEGPKQEWYIMLDVLSQVHFHVSREDVSSCQPCLVSVGR